MIPLVDVKAQYAPLIPDLRRCFDEVVESGQFILGPNLAAFEDEAAAYLGVPQTIGVANGTDALVIVLDALGIGPGDEVICPAFTFYATAESIAQRGATPVFADIDPRTLNLDTEDVAKRITANTKAIMPVHLFGRPAPLDELAALGLPIVEDAAQAFGSPSIARHGVASTFSFYPTKNLFAFGDGGLVAVLDEELGERVRLLRFHGSSEEGVRARRLQLAPRRAAGSIPAGVPDKARRMDAPPTRSRGAVPHARARRPRRGARGRARPRLSPVRLPLAGTRPDPRRAGRGGDRNAPRTTCRRSICSPRCGISGGATATCRRPSAPPRENFSVPLWAGIDEATQERVVSVVREAVSVGAAR